MAVPPPRPDVDSENGADGSRRVRASRAVGTGALRFVLSLEAVSI